MLQLGIAKELGMSFAKLNQEITPEELIIWSLYFEIQNENQEKAMKRRR
jgi:hypothetical protein